MAIGVVPFLGWKHLVIDFDRFVFYPVGGNYMHCELTFGNKPKAKLAYNGKLYLSPIFLDADVPSALE